jgi:valyl-tRNA synthetase
MTEELSKLYDPRQIEARATALWSEKECFRADAAAGGDGSLPAYTIVIPPPNVTAALHLGHALNNTLQDILIRWRRMQGCNTLWMPGTDHAGIATQTVVEKRILAEEGKRRTDFSRDEFIGRVQTWKDEYEARIIEQLQKMGCSCDWRRTRFTMDEVCARAVRETFFRMFQDGLIYRGKRLVNWDPATQTVLADDEVEHETVQGHFWYLRYPLVEPVEIDGEQLEFVTVATTRPETMLGDTAVAMNPSDPRAKALVGKKVRLPLAGRKIPIIADEHVVLPNPESEDEKAKFSTGFLKVTPAHDPDDWAIGQRHDLPIVNVMAPDGTISDQFGWEDATGSDAEQFLGMDRFEAREAIVEWFRQEELLQEVREYTHDVGHSYRSHVPIEPYLSDQWYIAVKKPIEHLAEKFGEGKIEGTDVPVNSLAGLALKPLLDDRLRFIPERYAKTYQTWLENLRDWPISRQLWWGHRIPVWRASREERDVSNDEMNETQLEFIEKCTEWIDSQRIAMFGRPESPFEYIRFKLDKEESLHFICVRDPSGKDKEIVKHLEKWGYIQDEDVLDTWFSSALWPFSTLGWPEDSEDLKTYYPGSVLCTAREIITLWVSRMVMMGQYCVGDIPFSDVFIHAMIQDGQGRKMSKSLGNGIDPLVAIDSHGADAMRFALTSMTTLTQDVRMPVEPMKLPDGRTVNTSPKFDLGRNFCNKLWNASRFALTNLEDMPSEVPIESNLHLEDRWILSRLTRAITEATQHLEEFKFSEPINALYKFFWNDLCDWYLEIIKPRMRDESQRPVAQRVLAFALDSTLRLFHPFLPFITEEIFQKLNSLGQERSLAGIAELPSADCLIQAAWPKANSALIDEDSELQIDLLQTAIRLIRDIRTRYQVAPKIPLKVSIQTNETNCELILAQQGMISHLTNLETLHAAMECAKPTDAAVAVADDLEIYVHGVIDIEAERKRLEDQKENLAGRIKGAQAKLGNENFVNRAKPQIVQRERERLSELQEQLATVEKNLNELPAQE